MEESMEGLLKDFEEAKFNLMDTVAKLLAITDLMSACLKPINSDSLREKEEPLKAKTGKLVREVKNGKARK